MDAREKVWRKLSKAGPLGVRRVSITSSPVFAPGDMDWGQFIVLTGNHGAGKTYLLRTLAASLPDRPHLGPSGPPDEPYFRSGNNYIRNSDAVNGRHTIRHHSGGVDTTWEVDLEQPPGMELTGYAWPHESPPLYGEYVDVATAFDVDIYWALEHGRDNEAEKHTAGPFSYSSAEIRVLRDITGRHYDDLRWYSYEADKDLIVPRLEGIVDGRTIPMERMSRGELWVHFLLYVLRTARPGSIILIDEPETHLSPVGHTALLDELARSTLAHDVQTIIATHSTTMIARAPASMLRMLILEPYGSRMIRPATNEATLRTLGHRASTGGLVFVEDELAKRIVTTALTRLDRSLAERVDVVDAGGRDEALAGARVLSRSQSLQVSVLLDGDQREHVEGDRGFPVEFLPGDVPDEELLRQVHADSQALADLLGQSIDDLSLALDQVRFTNHQFWFTRTARHLSVDEHALVGHLVNLWLRNVEIENEFRRVFARVRDAWSHV